MCPSDFLWVKTLIGGCPDKFVGETELFNSVDGSYLFENKPSMAPEAILSGQPYINILLSIGG